MIRVLDELTINKIAAGEVVEGPFSVVKELVENSIDAKSTSIVLEIKEGGKKLIRITDNGIGIPESQVETAFLRHATSKITQLEDLESILSLGFRGEALASIASVAQVEMITRPADQPHGINIEVAGGKILHKKQVGCPTGTTIMVKNIFFNTPARMKFMKSTGGETTKISEIITRLALSKPDVSFKYINNNNIMFTTPGNGDLSQVILSVFDRTTFKNLIPIRGEMEAVKIDGFISQPSYARGNRSYEITFINGRFVKNKLIFQAIENAYKERLPINKYPVCMLSLEIDPKTIDVNVHPTKTEVKFHNEDAVYQEIYRGVKTALDKRMLIPKLEIKTLPKATAPSTYNITEPSKSLEQFKPQLFHGSKGSVKTKDSDKSPEISKATDVLNATWRAKGQPKTSISNNLEENPKDRDGLKKTFNETQNNRKNYSSMNDRKDSILDSSNSSRENNASETPIDISMLKEYSHPTEDKTTSIADTNTYQAGDSNVQNQGQALLSEKSNPSILEQLVMEEEQSIMPTEVAEDEEIQESFLASLLNHQKIIGQLFNTYIILEKDSSMYLIDQHAAHERLVYNRLMKEYLEEKIVSQQLLQPEVIQLSAEDFDVFYQHIEDFNRLGFDIEDFGQNSIIIRGVPMVLGIPRDFNFLIETIDDIKNGYDRKIPFQEKVIQKSCKEAIRGKDQLDQREIDELLRELRKLEPPLTCPHGRPIVLSLTQYEIEKYFKRIQ
ncbi:DNA mismatch repair endonuclease MutL [Alkaliphilus hydrothermalis]|uniref:DNA mismatch repair protein MutL n=1 Tax=Alkaliphilus hydrothermalis TaxID=1482730 RepID=A0ABS2NLN2_9FIRM|nr:DNA mismatch repair endonuclease MutL [Alkaliphilus hydrothermalis]MBM7613843.1 DNA mismatch repair protein MutL [Alkaliphilus hydrothermalis]